jgi:hypothetical protein
MKMIAEVNNAVMHFDGNDGYKSQGLHRTRENYDIATLTYLTHLQEKSPCLKYVFKSGITESFIRQLRWLNMLATTFQHPALFISPSPGKIDKANFLCGVLYQNQLLLITSSGEKIDDDLLATLLRITESSKDNIIKQVFIGKDVLPYKPSNPTFYGQLCIEFIKSLSKNVAMIDSTFRKLSLLPAEKMKENKGLKYHPVSTRDLCWDDNLHEMTADNAIEVIEKIRKKHHNELQTLPAVHIMQKTNKETVSIDEQNDFLYNAILNSPEQMLVWKLSEDQLPLEALQYDFSYQKLQRRFNLPFEPMRAKQGNSISDNDTFRENPSLNLPASKDMPLSHFSGDYNWEQFHPKIFSHSQLLVDEPAVIRIAADLVTSDPVFEQTLWNIIESSKHYPDLAIAAANAITILVATNISFAGKDLRYVRIPHANLTGGNFEGADMREADLRQVNFTKAKLNRADLSGCCIDGIKFEQSTQDQSSSEPLESQLLGGEQCFTANDCSLLNVHGLTHEQRNLLVDLGSHVQISTRPSAALIIQPNQLTLINNDKTARGAFKGHHLLSHDVWLLTVARRRSGLGQEHAFLVLESIENGYHRIRRIDFLLELRYSELAEGETQPKVSNLFGQGLIEIMDKSLQDIHAIAPECNYCCYNITLDQGIQILKAIYDDKSKRLAYCTLGCGGLYRLFTHREAVEHHNSVSWIRKHLEAIGIDIIPSRWTDSMIEIPSNKI